MSTEEQQKESAFLEAVYTEMKKHPEDELVMIDCPCGGKIKAIRVSYGEHVTVIAKCNLCKREMRG